MGEVVETNERIGDQREGTSRNLPTKSTEARNNMVCVCVDQQTLLYCSCIKCSLRVVRDKTV